GYATVPVRTCDHVVAVAQGSDARAAHLIATIATHKAIGVGDGAADPRASVAPGHCSTTIGYATVPSRTCDHIIAVAQGSATAAAHRIPEVAADETIGVRDGATDPRAATTPRRRPARAVPVLTYDHVVAIAQDLDQVAHLIPWVAGREVASTGVAA